MCGEKDCVREAINQLTGSPPRMRGKVSGNGRRFHRHGITPACAGKSQRQSGHNEAYRDHPRVCGEKLYPKLVSRNRIGSPPRMRGKVLERIADAAVAGITPAYAGKRAATWTSTARARDHPRVCGEKPTQTAPTPVSPISSMARWVTRVPGPSSSTEMPAAGI